MKRQQAAALALALLAAGCSGDDAAIAPTPAPSPSPSPSPNPTPTPTPTPSETTAPASYMKFSDVYVFRMGAGITLPSACSGFVVQSQPPAPLPVSAFGQGLTFRFVLTPNVWAVGGDLSVGFDGRNGDADATVSGAETAFAKTIGSDTFRLAIGQPGSATAFEYTRLAAASGPVQGANRQYQCVIGISTLPADLATAPSGGFPRTAVAGTAHVRDGATSRIYSLTRSTVTAAADMQGRRATITLRLIGTPQGGGSDVQLGSYTASAPIDPANGNFTASLASSDRPVTATISGRFFGPQAVEIGAALGGSVPDSASGPAMSFAGAAYGAR